MSDISRWAQALFAFPNVVFCVLDTTGVKRDSDIIGFTTMDLHGSITESLLISPARYPGVYNTEWTGITSTMMEQALDLPAIFPRIKKALAGKFVLAYGRDFVLEHLDENATYHKQELIFPVGECLMYEASQYFRVNHIRLVDACRRIGHTLEHPSAEQRAQGQLALLRAMAAGITSMPAPAPIDEDEDQLGDLDDQPF